jgi:uncharacterized protein YabN with tetrapyrrole methylase and pyrophosphatase domain
MILASNNAHKLDEFRAIFADMGIEIIPQSAAGCDFEVDETGDTFEENAYLKAIAVTRATGQAAIADLEQELTELKQAVAQGSADAQQEELGDVLFSAANVSRFLDCDAEEALDAATVKFVRRFREMERLAAQQGCAVDDLSAAELDKLWKRAKEVFTKR